ncbi:ATP-binding cassette domain-containing protein [Cohnella sp. GCM10020058]|uniref:ATP-binding cassette domain-containing protein n=1 Tax=Cohnella sp. GCM10020058 TaxID=3317330 RepID=UPI00362CC86B
MKAIETKALRFEAGPYCQLEVDAGVLEGKVTAIVGPNGSGKSTLLHLIAGLLKPAGGTVVVRGRPAAEYTRLELATELAMLPQSREALPELTVRELVAFGRTPRLGRFRQRLGEEDEREIDWALRQMSMRSYEDRMVHTLSGGERQKALIAMALAQKTGILLLDEPTTYLDIAHQLELMRVLKRLNREAGLTIVMVLHDLQQAAAFCDELIALKSGSIAARGVPRRVITSAFLRDVYEIEAEVRFDEPYPLIIPLPEPPAEEEAVMVATDTYRVASGEGERLVAYWSVREDLPAMPGFLGMELLQSEKKSVGDEISVITRWRTAGDADAWREAAADYAADAAYPAEIAIRSHSSSLRLVKVRRMPFQRR